MMMGACNENTAPAGDKPAGVRTLASALGNNNIVDAEKDGTARFITGELGTLPASLSAEAALTADLGPALASIAPQFKLDPSNLILKRAYADAQGDLHYRYGVLHNGRAIIGGELRLHARAGKIFAANTNVRGDLVGPEKASVAPEAAISAAAEDRLAPQSPSVAGEPSLSYFAGRRHPGGRLGAGERHRRLGRGAHPAHPHRPEPQAVRRQDPLHPAGHPDALRG
jgi:vibriolysin